MYGLCATFRKCTDIPAEKEREREKENRKPAYNGLLVENMFLQEFCRVSWLMVELWFCRSNHLRLVILAGNPAMSNFIAGQTSMTIIN